jgi:alpha-glucosidase
MKEHRWWQDGIVYEVYVRSFADADGDGIGDLAGLRSRLDYLAWLGTHAVWITPFYPSPMVDNGYDVADYTDVDPLFGTLDDFDALVADAHARGLRVVCDFVPNHTSDRHPWFSASRSSRDDPKRDWYLWRDPAPDGGPPTNWISEFGGPAWTLDEKTGQYYYHAFASAQPDLNWRNRQVRDAMYDALRFWLDRGVDGFRVDVMWHLVKDEVFRDNPANPDYREGEGSPYRRLIPAYSADQPEVHEVVAEMRAPTCPSTSTSSPRPGTLARSRSSSTDTRASCRRTPGRTGCSETTTSRGSRAGSATRRRGLRRSCSSRCGAHRRSTTGRSSAFATLRSRPTA